ncbi:MAG: rRNA maturation RNase YbeY [Eubacterium sp.]|nr:rRNA maturation RNase YbeY [Eubacterium sp.]
MTVEVIYETEDRLPFAAEPLLTEVIDEVLKKEACPFDAQVSVSFVDDEEIRNRNRDFRQLDRVTDVLSFPLVPFRRPADFRFLEEGEEQDCFDPDTGELCLGDIVINTARVRQQAEEYGHSLRRETAFLTAHSMLHLLGYDHMTEEEAAVMENKQEAVLQELGITREAAFPEE